MRYSIRSWQVFGWAIGILGFWVFAGRAVGDEAVDPYMTIPAAKPEELTSTNGWPSIESYGKWTRSLGGPTSNRFSTLDQINKGNVSKLQRAWIYDSDAGKGTFWTIECNPIVVDGVMYGPTASDDMVALNAATGTELWRYHPQKDSYDARFVQGTLMANLRDMPARRGLLFWPGDADASARLIFGAGNWVYALDPKSGRPIASFGQAGRTALPMGATVGGAVWKHIYVTAGYQGDAFGYDVISGKMLWRFHTIPDPGEFGSETWENRGDFGANCWGGMALDESRGIAYISTGSPKPNFIGPTHLGDNLFGNCVIALDAATGKRLWHFQEIRHDVWDLDIPAPPNLVTIMHDGRKVDAVAQVTKFGNTLLLDRVTGKPLFPFRFRRAPASRLKGEKMPAYQPDVQMPEPFARQVFTPDDITNRTPAAHAFVVNLLKNANMGWFAPVQLNRPTVFYGPYGGANWPGASFDPRTGRLYVTENEMGVVITAIVDDDPPPLVPMTAGEKIYQQDCASCHRSDRRGGGAESPSLHGLRHRLTDAQIMALWKTGRGLMPPAPPMTEEQRKELLDFLMARDRPPLTPEQKKLPRFTSKGWGWLYDNEGYPGVKPPWGALNCLDLNTGKLLWKVVLGEYDVLTKAGIPKTGTENFGGATVTAGGLVFCAGTLDNKIRAFDANTGEELWSAKLPWRGSGPPSVYAVGDREYVVLAATGGGTLNDPTGDAWVAFALPQR